MSSRFVHVVKLKVKSLSHVRLSAAPWTVALQAPPSMGFSRHEYWSGLPFPSPGDLPDPGIEPRSPTLQADALTSEPPGKPHVVACIKISFLWLHDIPSYIHCGFPAGSDGKASACNVGDLGFHPWVRKIPWRRAWQPTPVFLLGESHGRRSLEGYSPGGHKESDTTERLRFHVHRIYSLYIFLGFNLIAVTTQPLTTWGIEF